MPIGYGVYVPSLDAPPIVETLMGIEEIEEIRVCMFSDGRKAVE